MRATRALAVLLVLLLAGCGSSGSDDVSTGPSADAPTSTTVPTAPPEDVTDSARATSCQSDRQVLETASAAHRAVYERYPDSIDDLIPEFLDPNEFPYDVSVEGTGPDATLVLTPNETGTAMGCPEVGSDPTSTTTVAGG